MNYMNPDQLLLDDNWSDLSQIRALPEIDQQRMHDYRRGRLQEQMRIYDVEVLIMVNPLSMRYANNSRSYSIFAMHVPHTILFMGVDGPFALYNGLASTGLDTLPHARRASPLSHFYGGTDLQEYAERFAQQVEDYLIEVGARHRKVALEYVNPSVTQALEKRDIEVIDGMPIVDEARLIKNEDELNCIRWSVAVAEHGAQIIKQMLKPGVTETQLWGLLNYTNINNDGDWHEGRMLASGPRINPWFQEASNRKVQAGDLVGFDTDMVGPFGYCADLSRTFHCGPTPPSKRQKELYRYAYEEVQHNLGLIKAGASLLSIQQNAWPIPEEFREQAYVAVIHGVGMCDEFPHLNQGYRDPLEFDRSLEAGMVICVESYIGAVGETDGVKLEEQVLVTDEGYEPITRFPFEESLLN